MVSLYRLTNSEANVRLVLNLLTSQSDKYWGFWSSTRPTLTSVTKLLSINPVMGIMYEGQFVGIIGISFKIKYFIAQYNGGWWLHYLVDEQYSGRGIGTEAIRQMLEIVKTETSIDSIYAGCYSDNYASIHLLKKFGFHLVRSTRNNQIYELVIQRIF